MVSSVYGKIFVSAYLDACSHMCLACIQFSGNASGFWKTNIVSLLSWIKICFLEVKRMLCFKIRCYFINCILQSLFKTCLSLNECKNYTYLFRSYFKTPNSWPCHAVSWRARKRGYGRMFVTCFAYRNTKTYNSMFYKGYTWAQVCVLQVVKTKCVSAC